MWHGNVVKRVQRLWTVCNRDNFMRLNSLMTTLFTTLKRLPTWIECLVVGVDDSLRAFLCAAVSDDLQSSVIQRFQPTSAHTAHTDRPK